jgi:NADP-dependent 3-hydroxy acid dehydrogenase YdfG
VLGEITLGEIIMLQNAVAIITGASSGIGAATALALAARGARLSLWARSSDRLAEVAKEAKADGAADVLALSCDVREESQVASAIAETLRQFGRIDVLINSAGLSLNGEVDGYSLEDWRTVIETNLTGTFLTCRAVLPAMKEQRGGQIINISSGAGRNGIKQMAAYCAAKFGVVGFTESLGLEVRSANIRVSVLLPGSVATNFSRTAKREHRPETIAAESRPIGYSLLPTEVAAVILAMLEQPSQTWLSEVVLRPLDLELQRSAT